VDPDADPPEDGPDEIHGSADDPLLAWEPDLAPLEDAPVPANDAAGIATETADSSKAAQIRQGLDDLVGAEASLESLQDSDGHDLARQLEIAGRLMSAGEVESALERLDGIYRKFPGDESLRKLTAEAEAAFIEKAYRHYLPPGKVPMLTRPMEELKQEKISPTEFFMLSRIDGTWDVRSIIRIAPMREADALRTLKLLRESGIIELKDPPR